MATQIDTTTVTGGGDATAGGAAAAVVVAPSDASLGVLYFGNSGPHLATAQSPYTSWSSQAIGAATGRNSQALIGHSADDNFQAIVTSPSNGPYYFTFTRSVNAWSQTAVGSTGDPNNAGLTGSNAAMWDGLDPQGRYWYVGIDDALATYALACGHYNGTAWTIDTTLESVSLGEQNRHGAAAAIIGNYLVVVYDSGAGHLSYRRLDVSVATLGSWSAATQVGTLADVTTSSVLSLRALPGGSTAMLLYSGSGGIKALTYDATADSWGSPSTLSSSTNDRHPCLIAGATGTVYAVWAQYAAAGSYALVGEVYNGGWSGTVATLEAAGANIAWPNGAYLASGTKLALVWTQGAASPWTIQFDSVAAPTGSGALALPSVSAGMTATLGGARPQTPLALPSASAGLVATLGGAAPKTPLALPSTSAGLVASLGGNSPSAPPALRLPAVSAGLVATLGGSAPKTSLTTTVTGVVLLPNIVFQVQREVYSASTNSTNGFAPYLVGVQGHVEPTKASAYTMLPDGTLNSDFTVGVPSGADIMPGDRLSSITLLDNVTPWPRDWASGTNTYFEVALVREGTAGFLPQRFIYIKRMTGGGPARYAS